MIDGRSSICFESGRVTIDTSRRQLLIDGVAASVGSRAFDVLLVLLEHRDRIVTKDEVIERVWRGRVVEENNLQVQVSALRKLLGPHAVVTVPGFGYRFTLVPDGPPPVAVKLSEPVPATALPHPHNLPADVNSFVGRDADVGRVGQLLLDSRLVTVTGFAGTGKTRLAAHVAAASLQRYPEGAWFVELAALVDPALVTQTIAGTLGLSGPATPANGERLLQALKTRRLLVVLDNCEHLVQACAEVGHALLRACPGVSILTTSREPLGIEGEQVYSLAPLPLPQGSPGQPDVAQLASNPAVHLFIDRARAADSTFRLDAGNADTVVSICRKLDGIPFALELAAARLRTIGVRQVETMLSKRFRLLTAGSRLASKHHQTLLATLDWSYALLEERDRALLRHLSVFRGGFRLDAASAVSGGCTASRSGSFDVLDGLAHLLQKSLLQHDTSNGSDWYWMLESVREYGLEKLQQTDSGTAAAEAHLAHFVAVAEEVAAGVSGSSAGRSLRELQLEHDNFRAALEFALRSDRTAQALRLCGALGYFWDVCGHYAEGRDWLARALRQSADAPPRVAAKALRYAGFLAYQQGDFEAVIEPSERALALSREAGDARGQADALLNLGLLARERGDHAQARGIFERVQAIHESLGELHTAAGATAALNLFIVVQRMGDFEEARRLGDSALAICRAAGDERSRGHVLNMLGFIDAAEGCFDRAQARHREAIGIFETLGHTRGLALALDGLGYLELAQGHSDQSRVWLLQTLRLSTAIGYSITQIYALTGLASLEWRAGRPAQAARLQGAASRLMHDTGATMGAIERRLFEANRSALLAALGGDAYEIATARGAIEPLALLLNELAPPAQTA